MNENILRNIAGDFVEKYNTLDDSASADEIRDVVGNFIKKYNVLLRDDFLNHTAGMWKYIPVPENEPEPFPEYKSLRLSLPECSIIASRVRGKKHKHEGTNCDDWFEVSNYGKIVCIAVADGAGSKKFSRIGAKISCMTAVSSMKKLLEKLFMENNGIYEKLSLPPDNPDFLETCRIFAGIVQESVINASESVETAFQSRSQIKEYSGFLGRQLKLNDFASTLLTSLVIPAGDDSGEYIIISCQIGDGISAVINKDNSVKLMGEPDSGDFSGETDFLTSPQMKNKDNLQSRTRISKSPASLLLVMTDGVADDYFPNNTQLLRLCCDLILNGIIPDFFKKSGNDSVPDNIPEPVGYACINDKSKNIPLHYTDRICSLLDMSLDEICENKNILSSVRTQSNEAPEKMLEMWLDNYSERGSFDDRTLVIVRFPEEKS